MVNTRRSTIGLHKEVENVYTMEESFNTITYLSIFCKRVGKLSESQKNAIEKTGFGNLLRIPCHNISKNLLAELIDRWCPNERAFFIVPASSSSTNSCSKIELTITPIDVALVLGLRVVGDPVILREDEPFSNLEKKYGATLGNRKITLESIEKRLNSLGNAANDDFVISFLLFTFATILFPNADKKVDSRYLCLLQTLDKVCSFAWGEAVLEDITDWLCKRKEMDVQPIGGCLIFLQIWSYEHIDLARPGLEGSDMLFPRACRWKNIQRLSRPRIRAKFEELCENQVVHKLELTQDETKIVIINEIDKVVHKLELTEDETKIDTINEIDKVLCKFELTQDETKIDIINEIHKVDQCIAEKSEDSDLIVVRKRQDECSNQLTWETPHSTSRDGSIMDDEEEEKEKLKNSLREEKQMMKGEFEGHIDEEDKNLKRTVQTLLEENQKLKKEINSLKEKNAKVDEEKKVMKGQFKEKKAELRAEISISKDLFEGKYAELREEIRILKDQLKEKDAELEELRAENQADEALIARLGTIFYDDED